MVCSFEGQTESFSINMIRYHLYQWWATKYSNNALVMISDFRDVFFQSKSLFHLMSSHKIDEPFVQVIHSLIEHSIGLHQCLKWLYFKKLTQTR